MSTLVPSLLLHTHTTHTRTRALTLLTIYVYLCQVARKLLVKASSLPLASSCKHFQWGLCPVHLYVHSFIKILVFLLLFFLLFISYDDVLLCQIIYNSNETATINRGVYHNCQKCCCDIYIYS